MKIENLKKEMKKYRKEFAMDQSEFAKFAGLTVDEVSVFECGTQVPTRSQILGLCKGLELNADETEILLNQIDSYKIEPVQAKIFKPKKKKESKKRKKIEAYQNKISNGEMTVKDVANETGCSFSYANSVLISSKIKFKNSIKLKKEQLKEQLKEEQNNNKKLLDFLINQKQQREAKPVAPKTIGDWPSMSESEKEIVCA